MEKNRMQTHQVLKVSITDSGNWHLCIIFYVQLLNFNWLFQADAIKRCQNDVKLKYSHTPHMLLDSFQWSEDNSSWRQLQSLIIMHWHHLWEHFQISRTFQEFNWTANVRSKTSLSFPALTTWLTSSESSQPYVYSMWFVIFYPLSTLSMFFFN